MILKDFYISLRDRITENVQDIDHVKVFNEQLLSLEAQTENPFPFTAVFVSFDEIEWENLSYGIQEGTLNFTLKIVTEFYIDNQYNEDSMDLDVFDLKSEVFKAVNGLTGYSVNGAFSNTSRVSELTDNNHDSYYMYNQTYTVYLKDYSGCKDKIEIPAGTVSLELVKELIIDNYTIRTGILNG